MKSRRGRGEGSIYRRNGLWAGALTVGYDERGRRRRHVVYGGTKQEVLEKMARLQHQALTGTLGDPQRLAVAEFLHRWLEDAARPAIRESTYTLYAGIIRRHIAPRIGGVRLSRLTAAHIQALLAAAEQEGASAALRQVIFRVLHRALRQAVQWSMITRNPCDAVTRPRGATREMQTLTPEQARRFLDTAREDRFYGLYAVLLGCGLRLGEALGLTWPDVDLERGTITVRRQMCEVGARLWLAEPKTASARRTVDLPKFVVEALREHEERARAAGTLLNDRLLVFTDQGGGPVRKSNLRRRSFEPLLRTAGIPRLRLHDLRHSFATLHLSTGVHPRVVQQALGHSNIAITLNIYSHVLPGLGQEAAAKLDHLLGWLDGNHWLHPGYTRARGRAQQGVWADLLIRR